MQSNLVPHLYFLYDNIFTSHWNMQNTQFFAEPTDFVCDLRWIRQTCHSPSNLSKITREFIAKRVIRIKPGCQDINGSPIQILQPCDACCGTSFSLKDKNIILISNQFSEEGIPWLLNAISPHCISSDQSEKSELASSSKSQVLARGVLQEFELQMLQYQLPCHVHLPVTTLT